MNNVNGAARHDVDADGDANKNSPQPSTPAVKAADNANAVLNPEGSREGRAPANNNSDAPVVPDAQGEAGSESKTHPAPAATPTPVKSPDKANPDADILLPDDFRKLEIGQHIISVIHPAPDEPTLSPPWLQTKPRKLFNTNGTLPEIANRRKVFVNIRGEYGEKIAARLKAYGRLEVVKTAGEAEFAVSYYDWAEEQRFVNPASPLGVWDEGTAKTVTGGTLIVTIRDPSERMPRIIWRKDDTDGGWFKRGDAVDKLTKRFISDLKKLRGGK